MVESRWVYQKLFVEPDRWEDESDRVLVEHVAHVSTALREQGLVDRVFYIRYSAGGLHLRHRLRAADPAGAPAVRRALDDAARSCPSIVRTELADYEPETDKHGGPEGIEVCERLFDASSRLALGCVERTLGRRDLRVVVAVWHFDALLAGHGVGPDHADAVLADYARYWRSRTGAARLSDVPPESLERSIKLLADLLCTPVSAADVVEQLVGPGLEGPLHDLGSGLAELDALARAGHLTTEPILILGNLAHLMNNRLGIPPTDEALVADLLRGAYRSMGSPP